MKIVFECEDNKGIMNLRQNYLLVLTKQITVFEKDEVTTTIVLELVVSTAKTILLLVYSFNNL